MSMSRKDFIVVADSVREARYHFNACEDEFKATANAGIDQVVKSLCRYLHLCNPNFDAGRFKERCEA